MSRCRLEGAIVELDQTREEMEVIEQRLHEEYELETERKRELLSRSGVQEEDLSKNGQMYLHVLSEAAELLRLKDTRTSSYLLATSDLINDLDEIAAGERILKDAAEQAQKRSEELLTESNDLENVKLQLEEATRDREIHENTTTMEQRTAEYAERERNFELELKALDAALADLNFDDNRERIEHHRLAALEKVCEEAESGNKELRKQLGQFHELPLNKELAAATLRQAQEDLAQLEDEFNRHIREMV